MTKTLKKAVEVFNDNEGSSIVRLDGFDSELYAVITSHGVNLVQGWEGEGEPEYIFLPDDCYEGLIKILQGQVK